MHTLHTTYIHVHTYIQCMSHCSMIDLFARELQGTCVYYCWRPLINRRTTPPHKKQEQKARITDNNLLRLLPTGCQVNTELGTVVVHSLWVRSKQFSNFSRRMWQSEGLDYELAIAKARAQLPLTEVSSFCRLRLDLCQVCVHCIVNPCT